MEDVRIRYYSKTGNTKKVAEYISEILKVESKEINEEDYNSPCGLLILGGAPYANVMSSKLKEYALNIKKENVKAVALFTTSNWSKRTVKGLKKIFEEKNIKVYDDFLYVHMLKVNKSSDKAYQFGLDIMAKYKKEMA